MRDPNRIDRIIEMLREAWHRNPDWRLNQLIINASDTPYDCDKPQECGLGLVYYLEDDVMEQRLQSWTGAATKSTTAKELLDAIHKRPGMYWGESDRPFTSLVAF